MALTTLLLHGGAGATADDLERQRPGAEAAIEAGWRLLAAGGSALDAVCETVRCLENEPEFNAGYGSCLTRNASVEMDASVMEGRALRAGAVTLIRHVRNPVLLARAVLEDARHVFLAGEAAERLAPTHRLATCLPEDLITPSQRAAWERRFGGPQGTVGAVAVDRAGHVAAATSTGGMMGKSEGRIGDSPIVGAGTYADDELGAASSTGEGEAIMKVALAKTAVDLLADGRDPQSAAEQAIALLARRTRGVAGVIVVDRLGRVGAAHNAAHMTVIEHSACSPGPRPLPLERIRLGARLVAAKR